MSSIKTSGTEVANKVVDFFVKKEVDRRVTALTTAVTELEKLEKEALKVKPDQQSFDADGKVVAETFSKAKFEEKKKAGEKIAKLRKAIEKALNDNDFGDLFNQSKGGEEKKAE